MNQQDTLLILNSQISLPRTTAPEQRNLEPERVHVLRVPGGRGPLCQHPVSEEKVWPERNAPLRVGRMLPAVRRKPGRLYRVRRSALQNVRRELLQLPGLVQVPADGGLRRPHVLDTRHERCAADEVLLLDENGHAEAGGREGEPGPPDAREGERDAGRATVPVKPNARHPSQRGRHGGDRGDGAGREAVLGRAKLHPGAGTDRVQGQAVRAVR